MTQFEMFQQRKFHRESVLTSQLARIAGIHSARVKSVELSTDGGDPAPGWSYDGQITLSATRLPKPVTVDDITVWLAVLMHEVGHCDVSPRTIDGANHAVFNMVEDAREEALLIGRLPGTAGPLTQAVARLILDHPQATTAGIWPLIAGRTYLPAEMRQKVRDGAIVAMGAKWVAGVAALVAEYMRLSDPGYTEQDEAKRIINKLSELLNEVPPSERPGGMCESRGTADPPIGGVQISPEDILGSGGDSDNDADDSDGDDGGGGGGSGDGDDESEGAGDGGGGDGESQTVEVGDASEGGGAGAGAGSRSDPALEGSVWEEAKKALEPDAASRQLARVILRRMREEMRKTPETEGLVRDKSLPSAEARSAVARLNRHLKPLIDAAEAGLDRMTSSGRIRPDRIAAGYRPDHVFDKWRLDQDDAVSAEIVVAVDTSGSMSPYGPQLSEAMWILRSVVQKTAANLTVISWNSDAGVITSRAGKTVDNLIITGGTNPIPMLEIATDVFSKSRLRRKWMIVMTDGDIHTPTKPETIAATKALTANGVMVSAIEFGPNANAEVFGENRQKIGKLEEIPEMIGALLREVYRSNVTR